MSISTEFAASYSLGDERVDPRVLFTQSPADIAGIVGRLSADKPVPWTDVALFVHYLLDEPDTHRAIARTVAGMSEAHIAGLVGHIWVGGWRGSGRGRALEQLTEQVQILPAGGRQAERIQTFPRVILGALEALAERLPDDPSLVGFISDYKNLYFSVGE